MQRSPLAMVRVFFSVFRLPSRLGTAGLSALAICATFAFTGCSYPPQNSPPPALVRFEYFGRVDALAFSPDSRYIAAGCHNEFTMERYWTGDLCNWDVVGRKEIKKVSFPQRIREIAFSPKGDFVALACGCITHQPGFNGFKERPGEIRVLTFPDLVERMKFEAGDMAEQCGFSPDGTLFVGSFWRRGGKGEIVVWSCPDLKIKKKIKGVASQPLFSFSADAPILMVRDYDEESRKALDTRFRLAGQFDEKPSFSAQSLGALNEGVKVKREFRNNRIFGFSSETYAADSETGEFTFSDKLKKARGKTTAFDVSNDQSLLAVATKRPIRSPVMSDGVLIWDMADDKEVISWTWPDWKHNIAAVAISPDKKLLAVETHVFEIDGLRKIGKRLEK
jgi:hypothetical protein